MLVLVAKPRTPARRLAKSAPADRIERNDAIAGQPRDGATSAGREPRPRVVHAKDDDAARACEPDEVRERRPRIAACDARRQRNRRRRTRPSSVRAAANPSRRTARVASRSARRRSAESESRTRQIGANNHAIAAREVERHLSRAAADLDDARVCREWHDRRAARTHSAPPAPAARSGCRAVGSPGTARARRNHERCPSARRPGAEDSGCRPARRTARRSGDSATRRKTVRRTPDRRGGPRARPFVQKIA